VAQKITVTGIELEYSTNTKFSPYRCNQ